MNKKKSPVQFDSILEKYSSDDYTGYFVAIPPDIRQQFPTPPKGAPRIVAKIGTLEPFQCGLLPSKNGDGYISLNKARQKALGLPPGSKVNVSIWADDSEYGAPMPEELEALLAQDDEAKVMFDKLTLGKKRAVMFGIERIKGVNARVEAAIKLLAKAAEGGGRWK